MSARQARSFDRAALEYEQGRPGWPDEVLELVPVDAGATVLDLAAGTGKLTRVLVEHYASVIAVEPLSSLRAILADRVASAEVLDGRAEAIPLQDSSVDAVFVAQAFHWFANDEAVSEIARVLRTGGVLASLWNESLEPSPLPDPYRTKLHELHAEMPPPTVEEDLLERSGLFGEETEASVEHVQLTDRGGVLAFAASVSWIASRRDREAVLAELADLVPEGEYAFRMRATVAWAVRL
ncbi:MAG: methyltransferase domain-containing protein [Gaiellaceae bacterium]